MRDPSGQGYRLLDTVKGVNLGQRRSVFRAASIGSIVLCLLILSFFFLYDDTPAPSDWNLPEDYLETDVAPRTKIALCDGYDQKSMPRLLASEAKYAHLIEDQFTIVIQTYRRPDVLNETLWQLTKGESKFLHSIIIAWNDLDTPVPEDWASPGGIKVHYRQSEINSLNEKLRPDPDIKTKAVLLGDDDTYYWKGDMEGAFQAWRETGQGRLVGAWPRASHKEDGKYKYVLPNKTLKDYNMVLTGLAFTHVAFMDYYSSDDRLMVKIRDYVNDNFNCEDIAYNFMAQHLTGCPALYYKGQGGARKTGKPNGMPSIGGKKGHISKRSVCLNDFAWYWGGMPLQRQESFMVRGELRSP